MNARRAIGIGCTTSATLEDMLALIAAEIGGRGAGALIATLDRRAPMAHAVARSLDRDVRLFSAAALANVTGTSVTSNVASDAVGTPSVAEAAALAAAGPCARLVISRRTGRDCTCALAEKA
ncbi:MAG: hypothetical protein NVS2B17_20400 [Candidatus Velthaea sp.]